MYFEKQLCTKKNFRLFASPLWSGNDDDTFWWILIWGNASFCYWPMPSNHLLILVMDMSLFWLQSREKNSWKKSRWNLSHIINKLTLYFYSWHSSSPRSQKKYHKLDTRIDAFSIVDNKRFRGSSWWCSSKNWHNKIASQKSEQNCTILGVKCLDQQCNSIERANFRTELQTELFISVGVNCHIFM